MMRSGMQSKLCCPRITHPSSQADLTRRSLPDWKCRVPSPPSASSYDSSEMLDRSGARDGSVSARVCDPYPETPIPFKEYSLNHIRNPSIII